MWNNFGWSATIIFEQLWISQNFTDVTLARADDCHMKAHKVILSPYSDFWKQILLKNFHKNHLVYLKAIKHKQCEAGLNELNEYLDTGKDYWTHEYFISRREKSPFTVWILREGAEETVQKNFSLIFRNSH